ncbi:RHS repeat-associated core domain-containing protein [Pseudomonas silesiensis]|uniref:RHS repeat domain-containing protein n=1 Tax=Pseudomonas silesiensis TaxID=1853130 RepID=UPI0030D3DBD8
MNHQRFDAAGRMVASRDPYLFALAGTEQQVPENVTQHLSLSGAPLLTDSVDAGWRLALAGHTGQVVERWDGRGSHASTEFDALMRPVSVRERGRDIAEHTLERFTYAGIEAVDLAHNLCGQLIRHDDPAGTLRTLDLGLGGALLKHTRQFLLHTDPSDWPALVAERDALLETGDGALTACQFSPTGELLQQIDALENRQAFAYSVAGELKNSRLTLAGEGQVEQVLVSDIRYNVAGQVEAETAGNGVITRHRYDPADGRLTGLSAHKADGKPLQDLSYRYDAVGNVLSIEDAAQPIRYFNNQRIEPVKTYGYDTLYQLIEATGSEAKTGAGGPALPDFQLLPPDPGQIANYTQTYHYDAGGNLLDLVHVGGQAQGRILTRARYSNRCLPERDGRPPTEDELAAGFDANGNLRELQPGQTLTWDLRNQLQEVRPVVREQAEDDREFYIYNGGGQRIRKVRSSQTNARTITREARYLPGLEIRTHSGTGETLHVITASAGSNSVQVLHWAPIPPNEIAQDQVRYCINDHLKSSTLELDQNADLISQEWYYPFGGTAYWAGRNATEAKYKTVRYSGKERDTTGLYYYGLRYYAPWLQRWINPDPAGYADGMNLFSMVNSNPVVYIDEQGNAGENINHEQYLKEFKNIIDEYLPFKSPSSGRASHHYIEKLLNIESISSESERKYFQRNVVKLRKTLTKISQLEKKSGFWTARDATEKFYKNLRNASKFMPFEGFDEHAYWSNSAFGPAFSSHYADYPGGYGASHEGQRPTATGSSGPTFGSSSSSSSGERNRNPNGANGPEASQPSSSSGRHHNSQGFGNRSTGNSQESTRSRFNKPENAARSPALPPGTAARIIEGYNLAIRIISNAEDERAIFPSGFKHDEYKVIALLVHPDKLKLEGFPHVNKAATDAFKIIGGWRSRAPTTAP